MGSKDIVAQENHAEDPLLSSQVLKIQGSIYQTLEIGKSAPTLKSYGYEAHEVEPPFVYPSRPELVDYFLIRPP